jgi:hypothetical protein
MRKPQWVCFLFPRQASLRWSRNYLDNVYETRILRRSFRSQFGIVAIYMLLSLCLHWLIDSENWSLFGVFLFTTLNSLIPETHLKSAQQPGSSVILPLGLLLSAVNAIYSSISHPSTHVLFVLYPALLPPTLRRSSFFSSCSCSVVHVISPVLQPLTQFQHLILESAPWSMPWTAKWLLKRGRKRVSILVTKLERTIYIKL